MSLVFAEYPKNCQNQGCFQGTVVERRIYAIRQSWAPILRNSSEICFFFSKKKYVFIICELFAIEVFPKTTLKKS